MTTRGRPKTERTLLERLLDNTTVRGDNDCWTFNGAKNNIGYGMIRDEKKMRTAHRVSFEEHTEMSIPKNLQVLHTCTNKDCVNPNHLKLGTRQDVTDDIIARGNALFWGSVPGKPGGARLGMKNPRLICPHCNRDIATNVFKRYHDDNCKHKQE